MGRQTAVLAFCGVLLIGCGGGSSGTQGNADPNLVGADALQYAEKNDAANSTHGTAEDTAYTLDAPGIAIAGAFEASSASSDYYLFSTGSYGSLDLRVFLDGKPLPETSGELTTSVDAQIDDGYDPAVGNDLVGIMVAPQMKYLIGIVPLTTAGKPYTIQVKAH